MSSPEAALNRMLPVVESFLKAVAERALAAEAAPTLYARKRSRRWWCGRSDRSSCRK